MLHAHSGPYASPDYSEQDTANVSRETGFIRVTHPNHPCCNQVILVLRHAGKPAYPEPCYLIVLPDGTRTELPVSWAVPAPPGDAECNPEPPAELCVGVGELLALAHLLQALSSALSEEVAENEPTQPDCTPIQAAVECLLVSGSLLIWERLSTDCQQELIQALADLLDTDGLGTLEEKFLAAFEATAELPVMHLRGLSWASQLVKKIGRVSIAEVAAQPLDDFVKSAVRGAPAREKAALEAQARELWTYANRVVRLGNTWKAG